MSKKNATNIYASMGEGHRPCISLNDAISKLPADVRNLVVFLSEDDRRKYLTANGAQQVVLLDKARANRVKTARQ